MTSNQTKTIVQSDFDSTIAEEDVSFMLLDAFTDGGWRQILEEYREGRIPVGVFSDRTFGMVQADERTLLDFVFQSGVKVRSGFRELLDYCANQGFEFVVVSNGLDFYIEAILKDLGIKNIDIFAAQTEFHPEGLVTRYIGPDGRQLQDGFKKAYTELFLDRGYRVVYVGDGNSDCIPASRAHHIFARDDLLAYCRKKNVNYTPFDDLSDVVRGLELLAPG
ncbi:MAG: MtnX-like HAD-IB family phosphatase [Dehalococcoidales bacterium]|jgi:2-hydroxy-3-keto-5-methylthiopentenyl-1-phosphate phosphatase|nr:MtnX-like HAD-IB family phosphatase [Dehalococcoidales bacterium]MDP7285879.1 MtnX-like HAD-IB family phosphatase [Dehalococcoidales bacterium]MDP7415842.1 MtnX-like HAD-IB family phosphatase [Dehalococcoidales bacterium]